MNEPGELNKTEAWVAEHAVPIFIALAVLIILGAAAVFWTYQKQGDTQHEVAVLRPKIINNSAKCTQQSLVDSRRAKACAARLRIGLINCRRSEPCRAALIAAITYPPSTETAASEGGATQNPSTAGQQPGPGQPGPHGTEHSPGPPQAPPGQTKPPGGPPAQTPGNGPPSGAGGGKPSGAHVEVCAVERLCVGLEAGLPKGIQP